MKITRINGNSKHQKNMKTTLYILTLFIIPITGGAQFYDFVSFNRTYFESDNWTSLNNGEVWDDPAYEIPLPFEFMYFGESISTIYIMEDGLGTLLGTKSSFDEGPLSLILPYDLDVVDRGYNENVSMSEIRYTTENTDGNQLFIIEWHNVGFYSEIANGISESYISFQVIFNRNFNAIELSFGESNIINPDLVYEDETGASVCLINNITENDDVTADEAICLTGDANNPNAMLFDISQSEQSYLIGDIPENKSYLFSVNDAVFTSNTNSDIQVKVYPTTAVERIYIDSEIFFDTYSLISVKGEVLSQMDWNEEYIDISSLPTGQYFITLCYGKGETITKTFYKF